jgi:hypothetical protein
MPFHKPTSSNDCQFACGYYMVGFGEGGENVVLTSLEQMDESDGGVVKMFRAGIAGCIPCRR